MRTQRLGSSGPELTVVGFGAWEAGGGAEWGTAPPDEQIVDAIRAALDAGMGWIDTAEVYGEGRSEELVGSAIAGRRHEILIATKVAPSGSGTGFRPQEVRRACAASLERLRTDHIDVYQLHWPARGGARLEDTWGAMAGLVEEGLVGFVGLSNFDQGQIERCEAIRHVDSLQQEFSMLALEDRELIRWCGEQGIGVLSYGPLAYGLLTGAITMETTFDRGDHRGGGSGLFAAPSRRRGLEVVEAMRPIAERLGVTLAELALAWNVHQPGVTAAIAGSRNADHARANAAAGEIRLDRETLAELDAVLSLAATP